MNQKDLFILLLILVPSFFIRLYRLDYHGGQAVFDEQAYYQKAATSYLENKDDPNYEHPPLGKEIIATGIRVLGNNPYGWRVPSVVFSLLGTLMVYFIFKELFGGKFVPAAVSALLSLDFMYLIHSRLGTMEIFYLTFIWACSYFLLRFLKKDKLVDLLTGSLFFALAFSTKWTAPLILLPFLIILVFKKSFGKVLLMMGLILLSTAIIYTASYIPYILRNSFTDFLGLQLRIYDFWATFTQKTGYKLSPVQYILNHAYAWPLNPAWAYDSIKNVDGTFQIVWAMYNPIIFFPSIILFAGHLVKNRFKDFFGIGNLSTLLILASFVPWFLVTRVQYTYYLLPAIPFLYGFLAVKLKDIYSKDRWLLCSIVLSTLLVSVYFYPLITDLPVPKQYLIFYPLVFGN